MITLSGICGICLWSRILTKSHWFDRDLGHSFSLRLCAVFVSLMQEASMRNHDSRRLKMKGVGQCYIRKRTIPLRWLQLQNTEAFTSLRRKMTLITFSNVAVALMPARHSARFKIGDDNLMRLRANGRDPDRGSCTNHDCKWLPVCITSKSIMLIITVCGISEEEPAIGRVIQAGHWMRTAANLRLGCWEPEFTWIKKVVPTKEVNLAQEMLPVSDDGDWNTNIGLTPETKCQPPARWNGAATVKSGCFIFYMIQKTGIAVQPRLDERHLLIPTSGWENVLVRWKRNVTEQWVAWRYKYKPI